MLGDVLKAIKTFLHQHIFCIKHDYKYHTMHAYPFDGYEECKKCGHTKWIF